MGQIKPFEPEKLIWAVLYSTDEELENVKKSITEVYGDFDLISEPYPFTPISDYYTPEMGDALFRVLLTSKTCVDPATLADIKLFSNALEQKMSGDGHRTVNIDPGLINNGRLILATTKKASHRIALGKGIYVEMTLFYARREWRPFIWTYMDFRTEAVKAFVNRAHRIYLAQRKNALR